MDVTAIMTSSMLWILSGIMVVASVSQAIVFFKESIKECKNLGIFKERYTAGIRSACITSLGPSLLPVVSVLALMAVVFFFTPAWKIIGDKHHNKPHNKFFPKARTARICKYMGSFCGYVNKKVV